MSRIEEKEKKVYSWWCKTERKILFALVFMMLLLVAVQAILMNEDIRGYISKIEKLEGSSIKDNQGYISRGALELCIVSPAIAEKVFININGEQAAEFVDNKASIEVRDGDIIDINAVGVTTYIEIKIAGITDNVQEPNINKSISIKDCIETIGKVRLK